MSAMQSVLLYDTVKEIYRKRVVQVQRWSTLRVGSAYRIVSEPGVMVITGVIPVVLLAKERRIIYSNKAENS